VFVGNWAGLSALQLGLNGASQPRLTTRWTKTLPATSPIIANGVLYSAGACTNGGTCVTARNPTTGDVLWSSAHIGGVHWQSPILADGALYVTDNSGKLWKFALPLGDLIFKDGFEN
jgi:outer membrane protein assembly factor BamB